VPIATPRLAWAGTGTDMPPRARQPRCARLVVVFFLRGAAATQHVPRFWPTVPAFSPSYYVTETITHTTPPSYSMARVWPKRIIHWLLLIRISIIAGWEQIKFYREERKEERRKPPCSTWRREENRRPKAALLVGSAHTTRQRKHGVKVKAMTPQFSSHGPAPQLVEPLISTAQCHLKQSEQATCRLYAKSAGANKGCARACHGAQASLRACAEWRSFLPSTSGPRPGGGAREVGSHHVTHMTGIPSWPSREAPAGTRRAAGERTRAHATPRARGLSRRGLAARTPPPHSSPAPGHPPRAVSHSHPCGARLHHHQSITTSTRSSHPSRPSPVPDGPTGH